MELRKEADAFIRGPGKPDSPVINVYFGGEEDSTDVGVLRVRIPVGTIGMTEHAHGGSDVVISPIAGYVRIAKGDESYDVHVGDSILIYKDEKVSLGNPGTEDAVVLVSAGPANFAAQVRSGPAPEGSSR